MRPLTQRQKETLDFIQVFLEENGFPPTVREVAERFGISVKGSYDHIKALEKKGFLEGHLGRSRAIRLVKSAEDQEPANRQVPVLGTVAAGSPLLAEENLEGSVEVPAAMLSTHGDYFALHVRGDSMVNAGILDGDLAVIRQQGTADNGEIVVAMVEDAVTLKRLFVESNRIQLKSENKDYPPIYTQDVRILGKLACVIRKYA
jgi:repressor LexA